MKNLQIVLTFVATVALSSASDVKAENQFPQIINPIVNPNQPALGNQPVLGNQPAPGNQPALGSQPVPGNQPALGNQRVAPVWNPNPWPQPQPRLGFNGRMEFGGMRVLSVNFNSPAQQMGLEPGDLILSINGMRFGNLNQYYNVLRVAAPHVHLHVRDIRTGHIVAVNGFVPSPQLGGVPVNQPIPAVQGAMIP